MSSQSVSVAIAQLNVTVGDLAGNAAKILESARLAYTAGARVLVTPELALCGYPPEDLLLRPAFLQACSAALADLAAKLKPLEGLHVVVGHPVAAAHSLREKSVAGAPAYNAASVLLDGQCIATYHKRELPNYQVFDERRYFQSGSAPCTFNVEGVVFGITICEDAWFATAALETRAAGAQVLLVLNASPFHMHKTHERVQWMRQRVLDTGMPLVFAHTVGGQDEVVFDGASFVLNAAGVVIAQAPQFAEAQLIVPVDLMLATVALGPALPPEPSIEEQVYRALVLGVRDYLGKNGFPGALLGLSGGVDSALVLAIAVDALGANNVRAVMMASPYTADISWLDSREMARRCAVQYDEIAIEPMMQSFAAQLESALAATPATAADTTFENIQARIRGTLLMALSNRTGRIVLTTGNKSEMATGYCTLYGDMAGGFAVIKDVVKTLVWRLCNWRNANNPFGTVDQPIPERIITRPPSAELKPDQTDQDSLPPYEVLDAILQHYMEGDESIESIVARGYQAADVERVTRLIKINEYKRRQAPPGIRITHRAFGRDWRYPITSKFRA